MSLLAFWPAPTNDLVTQITVLRAPAEAGPYTAVTTISATDYYGFWVTSYEDEDGTSGEGRGFVLMPTACPIGRAVSTRARQNYENIVRKARDFR